MLETYARPVVYSVTTAGFFANAFLVTANSMGCPHAGVSGLADFQAVSFTATEITYLSPDQEQGARKMIARLQQIAEDDDLRDEDEIAPSPEVIAEIKRLLILLPFQDETNSVTLPSWQDLE